VNTTAIAIQNGESIGRCTIDFGFVINDRYFVATALGTGSGYAMSCSFNADNQRLDCFRYLATTGAGSVGEIMVLIY